MSNNIKTEIYNLCNRCVEKTIEEIETAIAERREAIKSDTKSSMGDKYETSREMLQQDINMNLERLSKSRAELAKLDTINPQDVHTQVSQGAFVKADNGSFYIAVSIGKAKVGDETVFVISVDSPMAIAMNGKKANELFSFNGKSYTIKEVF